MTEENLKGKSRASEPASGGPKASAARVATAGPGDDADLARKLQAAYQSLTGELHKMIVGMEDVMRYLLCAVFCRGHCLMVGVPGLAKTLLVSTLAQVLDLRFRRIQFTPDLMPTDITGTEVIEEDLQTGHKQFLFRRGPVFTNLLLADEINRTPPKTQAALLEAMQERHVSVAEKTYPLDDPFFVLATQNPIEQEGTYPLPEAQLDRFMFLVHVNYPSHEDEIEILRRVTSTYEAGIHPIFTGQDILDLQALVRRVPVPDHVYDYAVRLAATTRITEPTALEYCKRYLSWGAGPRAGIYMILGGKAHALLSGRFSVSTEDVREVAKATLRHRLVRNFAAEAEGVTADMIIDKMLEAVPTHAPGKMVRV